GFAHVTVVDLEDVPDRPGDLLVALLEDDLAVGDADDVALDHLALERINVRGPTGGKDHEQGQQSAAKTHGITSVRSERRKQLHASRRGPRRHGALAAEARYGWSAACAPSPSI